MNKREKDEDLFKNKRRMAWVSFSYILLVGMVAYFVKSESPELIETVLWICASFVGLYYGLTTIADYGIFKSTKKGDTDA